MNEHICVLGLGYIGLPTSIMFVSQGCMVTGVDVNNHVIEKLQKGNLHIHEVGLAEEFQKALNTGLFNFSQTPVYADIFIIAVPTPFKNDKKADMSYVLSAANSIVPVLRPGNMVILESYN
jgi:UDP-N-acetyl-D-mannosaminuronic acid dehydrogenase